MRTTIAIACIALLTLVAAEGARAQQSADTIVTRGKILTVDTGFRTVEALAITNGRIVATGTSAEIARYAGKNTRVIDVAGATVIPGLIDNHFHFTRGFETWHQQARFEGVDSRREALRILAAKAASLEPGDWIMVQGGWTPRQFADAPGGFTLEELDGVAPKNPLFVQEGYSVVYANSLALKAVGLNPAEGARRNAQGLVSFQPPMALYDAMPKTSPAQREQNLTDFMRELNSSGLTGVYSLGQSDFLAARAAKGPLPVRLWETLNFNAADPASASKAADLIARSRPNRFDGQHGIFGLGEVLYGPFFDLAPRKEPWPAEIMSEYGKLAMAAARGGWHVHQHVINNNAVTDLLDTLEQVNKTQPLTSLRWTLGHVYDISATNIARAKAMGITLGVHGAAMQAGARMPLRRIADSGIVFGLGTDATIVSHYNPFVTLGWVVSGLDVGGNKVLDETLTREEALIAHTRSNAYLFFQEKTLGSLEVGKQADLLVLDRDYMTVPVSEIKRIRPKMTMVGGRVVFDAADAKAHVLLTPGPLTDRDKADIQRLWSDYRDTLFACKGEGYADLFATPGGYFASAPRGEIRERQALIEMVVGYDRCEPPAKRSSEPSPSTPAAASPLPVPVIETAPEGARARIVNSRGGGYYDDVYVKTPTGWKFKSRTVISDAELAAGLKTQDFIEIRSLAGDDHGYYDDIYGQPDGDIKPRALSKPGEPFRTSGLRLTLGKDGTVNGLAYLRNNGGHYEDVYVKTPQGWRIKERKYFKP